ncbi:amino acid adenylation domain-containing protein [Marinactinospora rubrisoli]|uniref:Phenyloxazoline synthase MbtB n=1 Tax=Marinactinospora rubrisoli TaxID=2715399 RepID=A0ABW2KK93_9ACTN
MRAAPATSGPASPQHVAAIVADVLGIEEQDVDPDLPLTALGLESFTAVRLRRRLRDDAGLDLPLTAFLGDATVASVARGATDPAASPAEQDAGAPLTPIQSAYWIGRDAAFPLGGVATFYYREYDRRPEGDPLADLDRLAGAWNRLVQRHPMLRMVVGPDAHQRILPDPGPYRIGVTDLRTVDADAARATLDRLRAAHSHQVRPADRWPLFDIHAALLPDGRTRLHLGIDVLALDLAGWMQILAEWGELVADPEARLPEPPATFIDVLRRRSADPANRTARERDAAYWRDRAATLPPGPRLPWSTDLAEVRGHRFTRREHRLTAREWADLRARAAGHGLSPTGVLLAAFGLTLSRWGATDPFALNTTLFDRPDDPESRHVVGDFTSTVVVEVPQPRVHAWSGFLDYAAAVNRRFWTDLEHRTVSGVEVLRDSADPTGAPSHPVVFTSGIGLTEQDVAPGEWLGAEVFGVSQTPQVALDHIVHEEGGELRVCWDWAVPALPEDFVAGMASAHARLLRRLAAADAAWRDPALGWDPSFLAADPLDATPFGAAGPLLDDPLRAAADRTPDAVALIDPARSVSHAELAARARRTAAGLAALGLGPGDLVAVSFEKGVDQVAALLGVAASGAGYVPVEPSWPAGRVASVCEQAGVARALVPPGSPTVWPDAVTVHEVAGTGALTSAPDGGAEPRRPAADDLAYVIFTSGSTGRPKGVAVEHRAARTTIDDLVDRFPIGPEDRVLALSAFSFDLSVHDIFGVLGAGGALVLPDTDRQRDPGHWLELMARHRVTFWNTAPALMEMLVEYAEIDPDAARAAMAHLRLVFLSADWIPVTLPDRLREFAPQARIVSLGGATEASIWSICFPIEEVDPGWPSIPYGRALRGQSFHVLDARGGGPRPVGEPGELHIGGAGLARGYIGDAGQTAERFIEHPILGRLYHTGDLGRWRTDGTIEFLGRTDRQVKIRGHRIELGEIESALGRVPGVRQAVAMSVRGPDDRPRLVGYLVESESHRPPSDDRLITLLRERVPDYMVPSRFVRMAAFPVTDNGKVDYKALANPYDRRRSGAAPAPPAAAEGQERPAGPSTPAGPVRSAEWGGALARGIRDALDAGLRVGLAAEAGELAPSRALSAAGAWAAGLAAAVPHGVAVTERLIDGALVELQLTAAVPASSASAEQAARSAAAAAESFGGGAPVGAAWPVEQGGDLARAMLGALAAGLGISVRVEAGELAPSRALSAAGAWAAGLAAAVPHGVAVTERLTDGALVELRLNATGQAAATGTVRPSPPSHPSPSGQPVSPADQPGAAEGVAAPAPAAPPGADPAVEQAVSTVLGELLGGPIDPATPFFRLGATSLTLVLAHRRLAERLGDPAPSVVDFFSHPTVRQLAAHITRRRAEPTAPPTTAPAAAPADRSVPSPATADSPGPFTRAELRRRARAAATEVAE